MISLMSVAIQGTLLPAVSSKLGMIDEKSDVRKTFNDYQGGVSDNAYENVYTRRT